jgi:hypothetical protein
MCVGGGGKGERKGRGTRSRSERKLKKTSSKGESLQKLMSSLLFLQNRSCGFFFRLSWTFILVLSRVLTFFLRKEVYDVGEWCFGDERYSVKISSCSYTSRLVAFKKIRSIFVDGSEDISFQYLAGRGHSPCHPLQEFVFVCNNIEQHKTYNFLANLQKKITLDLNNIYSQDGGEIETIISLC